MSDQPLADHTGAALRDLHAAISRIRNLDRVPQQVGADSSTGQAYTRGWQAAFAAVDTALLGTPTGPQEALCARHRYRAWLTAEHAKAARIDQATNCPPELKISPHNGIAAGLSIALHGLRQILGDGHDNGPSVGECAQADRAHWTAKYDA